MPADELEMRSGKYETPSDEAGISVGEFSLLVDESKMHDRESCMLISELLIRQIECEVPAEESQFDSDPRGLRPVSHGNNFKTGVYE